MTATVAQIRAGLAAALAPLKTATPQAWNVNAYMQPNPHPPAVDVIPDGVTFDLAMGRGLDQAQFLIRAVVGFGTGDQGPQETLDALIDPTSSTAIKTLVETDKTLGSVVQDCRVTDVSAYKAYSSQTAPLLGCEWTVEVYP